MSREELPFEVIQTWKPEQLKEFCRKRDLKVSGPKAELVARVFAAAEMGIAIKPTAQERIGTTEKEKATLLIMPNGTSYGGAFGSKMQLDRNLHPTGSYCMLFVRELYAIRSCLYGIRSYTPFYRTGHSVVLHIRSYSPFGRTEHSVVLPIRSYRAFGRTPVVVGHGSQSIMGELSFRAQFQRVLMVCGPRAATNFNYQKYKSG